MKTNSHKIILAIIFVFALTFSMKAGEGQCPQPTPVSGLIVQENTSRQNDISTSVGDKKIIINNFETISLSDFINELIEIFF